MLGSTYWRTLCGFVRYTISKFQLFLFLAHAYNILCKISPKFMLFTFVKLIFTRYGRRMVSFYSCIVWNILGWIWILIHNKHVLELAFVVAVAFCNIVNVVTFVTCTFFIFNAYHWLIHLLQLEKSPLKWADCWLFTPFPTIY